MSDLPQIEGISELSEIGRGGFGVVYRGLETEFGRQVAIKVLSPSLDERTRRRFARERRAMGSLSDHPNIVTVYRGGVTPSDQPYLVMELLRGGSLQDRIRSTGPLHWRDAALVGAKLADALAVAHRAGILHRDIKPANVFQTESGEPKLGDFGIARFEDGQDSRTGSITASIAHAAPEIVDGQRGDERSDIYSLASTLYALTTGTAPFSQDPDQGLASLIARVSTEEPRPPGLGPAAADFEHTLLHALAKSPEARPATAAEFGNMLRRTALAPEPVTGPAAPPGAALGASTSGGAESTRTTSRGQTVALAGLALLIAVFGGWAAARAALNSQEETATPTPDRTEATATPAGQPTAAPVETVAVEPTTVPTPLPVATATTAPVGPDPTATAEVGRTNDLGSFERFVEVTDVSGAITVSVPPEWARELNNGSEIPLEAQGLGGVRVLAVGGTFAQLGGTEERDLSVSGIYVFAVRLGGGITPEAALTVAAEPWGECPVGDRSSIDLPSGPAEYELRTCPGFDAGIIVMGHVPRADPSIGVSVYLQFADMDDLSALPTILSSLAIDPDELPEVDLQS